MRALISMRAALEDPEIMGNAFAGDSWLPWRAIAIAAHGEELSTKERTIFTELTGRPREPMERCEELIAIKGRRGGWTSMMGAMLTYNSCLVDYSDSLGLGETALALCLAPNARQAQLSFDRTEGLIDASEMLRSMVLDRTKETITLDNSVSIEVRPASFRGLRGVTCCFACLDESCYFLFEGQGSNTDSEILTVLRPSLITTRGMLLAGSTPYAPEGETYRLFRDHYRHDGDPKILVSKSTSRQTNPTLPQSIIDRALARDPIAARSEYLGEWRHDVSNFIDREVIERCIDRGVTSRPYNSRYQYVGFADVASGIASGGDGDRYAWSIGHREGEQIVLDYAVERKPPFDAAQITAELAACCRTYHVTQVAADRFSHGFVSAELSKHGLTYKPSDRDKSRLYLDSLPQIASPGRVRLLDLPAIPEQYGLLERKAGANGHDRVDARGNRHEDLVNTISAVIALLATPESSAEGWLRFMAQQEARAWGGGDIPAAGTDFDAVRAGELPWKFYRPEDWVQVKLPPAFAAYGEVVAGNTRYPATRRVGLDVLADVRVADARELLRRPIFAACNAALCQELGITEETQQ
jgi:hypothetical protein